MAPVILIREPDVHHNNWGIELRWPDEDVSLALLRVHGFYVLPIQEMGPDVWGFGQECDDWNKVVEQYAKDSGFQPFHQGGHHSLGDVCRRWHYWEFWGLTGAAYGNETEEEKENQRAYKAEVQRFILDLPNLVDQYRKERK